MRALGRGQAGGPLVPGSGVEPVWRLCLGTRPSAPSPRVLSAQPASRSSPPKREAKRAWVPCPELPSVARRLHGAAPVLGVESVQRWPPLSGCRANFKLVGCLQGDRQPYRQLSPETTS